MQQSVYKGDDYVVDGALTTCSGCKLTTSQEKALEEGKNLDDTLPYIVAFQAKDRQMEIGLGMVGTQADTSPEDNFDGRWGTCRFLNNKNCMPHLADSWFQETENIQYGKDTFYEKKEEFFTQYQKAVNHVKRYMDSCETDFNEKGLFEDWSLTGSKSEYQKELELKEELDIALRKELSDRLKDGINTPEYYFEHVSYTELVRASDFGAWKTYTEDLGTYLRLYKEYAPSEAKKNEAASAEAELEKLNAFLKELEDARQNPKTHDVIMESSVLVCLNGGVIRFLDDGQERARAEADRIANIVKKVIVLDPGHGGDDSGAISRISDGLPHDADEKDLSHGVIRYLDYFLEQDENYTTILTKSYDPSIELKPIPRIDRIKQIKIDHDGDLFISSHANGGPASASGYECIPLSPPAAGWPREHHKESFRFAELMVKYISTTGIKLRDGGIKYCAFVTNSDRRVAAPHSSEWPANFVYQTYGVVENAGCPAVLSELGFIASADDYAIFGGEQGWKKGAALYYQAICEFFGTDPFFDINGDEIK